MASAVIDFDALKLVVLEQLKQKALRPTELLSILGDKYSDVVVKEVVLRLLQEQSITLTSDRQLQLSEGA